MAVVWEHASRLINNEIMFIFNEFDMLIDNNSNVRLSEEVKRNLHGFYEERFYNITDGLALSLKNNSLDFSHLSSRISKIVNQLDLDYKDYFKIINRLKKINVINIIKNILLIENWSSEILFNEVSDNPQKDVIVTLNSLKRNIDISDVNKFLSEVILNSTIVIVDSVIPRCYIQTIYDKSFKVYYIGSEKYCIENKQLFDLFGCSDCIIEIKDITVEDYFNEIYKYVEAYKTEELLVKFVRDNSKQLLYKIFNEVDDRELINLINRNEVFPIRFNVLPAIILYFCKNRNYTNYFNSIFKGFYSRYNCDLINSLKSFHSILSENNLTFVITPVIWNEIKVNTLEDIDDFFMFLDNYKQFQIYHNGNYQYINEIFASMNDEIKNYAEVKLIEYVINNNKLFILVNIENNLFNYVRVCSDFCEHVLEDKSIDMINIDSLPLKLKGILNDFKNKYQKVVNSEWIHQDGMDSCNNTQAPFAIDMDKKQNDFIEEKIMKYNGFRPYISNNVIYVIESDKINIINLFTGDKRKILLSKGEKDSNFYVYNKNLILTNNNGAYIVNNQYEKKPLNVKIDNKVYNGLRIRDDYVYYFPSSKVLAKANINDFISGNSLLKTKSYKISTDKDIFNIKDFIPIGNNVFWITDLFLGNLNMEMNEVKCINLVDEPHKIFYTYNNIYLLTANSVYQILYDETLELNWITGITDWEKYTCYCNYLITSFEKNLIIIDLTLGKQRIIKSELIKDKINDLIVAGNKLLIIDNAGLLYECSLSNNKIEEFYIKLLNSFSVKGSKSLLSYAYRRLSISNSKYLYIISA